MHENPNFVVPMVFFIGETKIDIASIEKYLTYTNQLEFLEDIHQALNEGIQEGEVLCSMFAKMCYSSLVLSKNKNITAIRSISDNIVKTIESKHGSVFEHCSLNFIITNCSRVFTHELVRHRVGTAFSQTSGRYVRNDKLRIVFDPILNEIEEDCEEARLYLENWYKKVEEKSGLNNMTNFDKKKKMTSALRRFLPNGQANEIGFSLNLRTLRQLTELRTSQHAEWEIRQVFNQIINLIKDKYKFILNDAEYIHLEDSEILEILFKNKKI